MRVDSCAIEGWREPRFPKTRYQGSKAKLLPWISEHLLALGARSFLDLFGGTGVVAHRMKAAGLRVTYNDSLRFNYLFAKALVENDDVRLSDSELALLLTRQRRDYASVVTDNFEGIYYTTEENIWIDQTIENLRAIRNPFKQALGFFGLAQACIAKRPYNLFHRKNLYLRLADVERSFGNKTSWDRPFADWTRRLIVEAHGSLVRGAQRAVALNLDALACPTDHDLVYVDPPYLPARGQPVDYRGFYHFLEGLARYDTWATEIDHRSQHRRLKPTPSPWLDKRQITSAFEAVIARYASATLAISYRSDGVPTEDEIVRLLRRYKRDVQIHRASYQYVLSKNKESNELLIIAQ